MNGSPSYRRPWLSVLLLALFTAAVVAKLKEQNANVQLYEADRGGHGAFHLNDRNVDEGWKPQFLAWMKQHGWISGN